MMHHPCTKVDLFHDAQAREGSQVRLHTVLLLLTGMLCVGFTAE